MIRRGGTGTGRHAGSCTGMQMTEKRRCITAKGTRTSRHAGSCTSAELPHEKMNQTLTHTKTSERKENLRGRQGKNSCSRLSNDDRPRSLHPSSPGSRGCGASGGRRHHSRHPRGPHRRCRGCRWRRGKGGLTGLSRPAPGTNVDVGAVTLCGSTGRCRVHASGGLWRGPHSLRSGIGPQGVQNPSSACSLPPEQLQLAATAGGALRAREWATVPVQRARPQQERAVRAIALKDAAVEGAAAVPPLGGVA